MTLLGSSCLFHASSKTLKTLGPFVKKVSGLQLARQDGKCANITMAYAKNSHQGSKTQRFFNGFLEGSKRPPRGLQDASLQPCFQEAPKSPQEAPKSHNLRMVLTFSTFLEMLILGIRHGGFCTFGSKTRPSVLQSGEHARTIR